MTRITLDGIAHAYGGKPRTEDGYQLKPLQHVWEQGLAYALLGPSGCGKTTLLNVISGLVIPSEGRLLFDDRDVTRLPTEQRNIAQVFQFPVIYDTMTVAENLAFPLKNRRLPQGVIDKRVAEIAAMLDLTGDLGRRARGLTADAKQKISLGCGLVRSDVSAVLFDEPLTVIDPALKWELRSKLKAVHRALDLLMIYVTHDQTEAMTLADRIVVLDRGRIAQVGSPLELYNRPANKFVAAFLGSPGMNFFPVKLERAEGDGARVALPGGGVARARLRSGAAGGEIELGVRPEHLNLLPADDPSAALRGAVAIVEHLGNATLVHVETPAGLLVVEGEGNLAILPGAQVGLGLNEAETHLFGADGAAL